MQLAASPDQSPHAFASLTQTPGTDILAPSAKAQIPTLIVILIIIAIITIIIMITIAIM